MKCPNCQADIAADSRFCDRCGHALTSTRTAATPDPALSVSDSDLLRGSDGVWRWTYELSLLSNPTVFITLIKVTLLASKNTGTHRVPLPESESGAQMTLRILSHL